MPYLRPDGKTQVTIGTAFAGEASMAAAGEVGRGHHGAVG